MTSNLSPPDAATQAFREPWEAHAFAIVIKLHERGAFTWNEWADALAKQISKAQGEGDVDNGETYYQHWLTAVETLVAKKGFSTLEELSRYRDAWDCAADRTPHGQPIELRQTDFRV